MVTLLVGHDPCGLSDPLKANYTGVAFLADHDNVVTNLSSLEMKLFATFFVAYAALVPRHITVIAESFIQPLPFHSAPEPNELVPSSPYVSQKKTFILGFLFERPRGPPKLCPYAS